MNFFKGLHKDNHPSGQPESTYRDAKNVILKEERGAVANEPGMVATSLLPVGYTSIGRTTLPDGRIIVFLVGGVGESEIGIIGTDLIYRRLVNDSRLNFSKEHPIQAIAKITIARTVSQQYPEAAEKSFEDSVSISETTTMTVT